MTEMMMYPASYAVIDKEEMTYLVGGATAAETNFINSAGWQNFLTVGSVFNNIARVFSAASSIVNNVNVIVTAVIKLNELFSAGFITNK